jgi:hypothetical protein
MKGKMMSRYLVIFSFLVAFTLLYPQQVLSHSGIGQEVGNYHISFTQEPLSPLIGENVKVTVRVTDENDKPVSNLKGNVIIKKTVIKRYVGKDAEQEQKEIYKKPGITDTDGSVGIAYTFNEQSLYDIEFIWGQHEATESAGLELFPRDPHSFTSVNEALKQIWLYVGIAFLGAIVGSIGTFVLLTATLHPKK